MDIFLRVKYNCKGMSLRGVIGTESQDLLRDQWSDLLAAAVK